MNSNKGKWHILLLLPMVLFISSCTNRETLLIKNTDPLLRYMGRVKTDSDSTMLCWPGSSVSLCFEGTKVTATLRDEKGDNYYLVIVDSVVKSKFRVDTVKHEYTLASGLKSGPHCVQLYKVTDVVRGKSWLYGLALDNGGKMLNPPPPRTRKMEFYGNSITSGYSVEDGDADSDDPMYCNNYLAYSSITARHYNADFHCISKSGIGLTVSWFPVIMPELFDRLDPDDSIHKWDFSTFIPDIVVIDLFQNDSWLMRMPKTPEFRARFGTIPPDENYFINAYKNFVQTIRSKYPNASIICTLGSMDAVKEGSPWPGYIEKAVSLVHDAKVYVHFFPYKISRGHPKEQEQLAMANDLIRFIDKEVK